jgi:hypothetical protein
VDVNSYAECLIFLGCEVTLGAIQGFGGSRNLVQNAGSFGMFSTVLDAAS